MTVDTAKRVLVSGGAGFLGSHLCERLLERGDEVLCVDNFFSSTRHNVAHLLDNRRMELLRHDVTFPLYVEVDEIFNLACPASPVHYQFDPVQTTKTNVIGAINMLGLAKRLKVKVLQASTSEVYGDPTVHPQPEEYWGNVTTKVSDAPRRCFSIIDGSTRSRSRSSGSSILMGHACILTTDESCRISSCRPYRAATLRFSVMEIRRAPSVTSMILSMGCFG